MFLIRLIISLVSISWVSIGFSQHIENNPEDFNDHECCSKYHNFKNLDQLKSVINPNPLMLNYDVKFYKLDLEAYDNTDQFNGNAVVTAEVTVSQMDTFSIELSDKLDVDSVFINSVKLPYLHESNNIYIELLSPITLGNLFTFQLFYHTPPNYSSAYYSSTKNPTYGNFRVSQSFSEPYSAHEWMPCKQELEDKADSVFIFITTDNDLRVAGPGLVTEVDLPDDKRRYEWRTFIPTAYYLICFAISDYQDYSIYAKPDSLLNDSILIQNYVFDYPDCLENNKASIDKTVDMIELLSNLYGLYPFF